MSNKSIKSHFEIVTSFILPSGPVVNNKAITPNKSNRGMISDTNTKISSVRGCNGNTGVDLRFHKREEYRTLSKQAKVTFRKQQASNLEAFEKSKCKALGYSD